MWRYVSELKRFSDWLWDYLWLNHKSNHWLYHNHKTNLTIKIALIATSLLLFITILNYISIELIMNLFVSHFMHNEFLFDILDQIGWYWHFRRVSVATVFSCHRWNQVDIKIENNQQYFIERTHITIKLKSNYAKNYFNI